MGNRIKADFLFAQPSFLSGVARLFDFWGLYDLYNVSPSTAEADARALYADWNIVGQELIAATERVVTDHNHPPGQINLFTKEVLQRTGA